MNVGIDGLYFARRGAARPDVVKQIMALAFMSRAISTAEEAIASAESIGTGVFARIKLYLQLENVVISYICDDGCQGICICTAFNTEHTTCPSVLTQWLGNADSCGGSGSTIP
jgi:hypothetical protein